MTTTIAVIHAAQDAAKAMAIAEAIGPEAAAVIAELQAGRARCVLLCWSAVARADPAFIELAEQIPAARRVDLALERAAIRPTHDCIDLSRWQGKADSRTLIPVRERALLIAASQKRYTRLWVLAGSVLTLAAGFFGLVNDGPESVRRICSVPGVRESVCAPIGAGGVATREQDRAYKAARAGGCDALRTFVIALPNNPHVDEAQRLIDARRQIQRTVTTEEQRTAEFFIVGAPRENRDIAVAATTMSARMRAAEACAGFPQRGWQALQTVTSLGQLDCRRAIDGWRCDVHGRAICKGNRHRLVLQERCG